MHFKNNQIFIGQVPVKTLAKKYGTPLFVYDENKIRANYQRVFAAFSKYYPDFRLYYAIKANNNLAIAQILKAEGAGIDAASVNEILLAKSLGLSGEQTIFSGNFLSDEDLKQGLKSKVIFNLDDLSLLPRLLKFGQPEILSFRVNPGIGKSNVGHFVVTGGPAAKFGIKPDDVLKAYTEAKKAGIKRFGVHMMTGSCITEPEYFQEITRRLLDIIGEVSQKLKINFEFIDLGGGLGIPYRPSEKELDIEKTAKLVTQTLQEKIKQYNLKPPRLCMEPARYFVGNAGYLIGKIHAKKESYQTIYGSDLGMNLVPRIIIYGAYHGLFVDGKVENPKTKVNLTGQICEQTDFWGKDRDLPALEIGDLIVMENCGAYCFGMSYQYNGRLLPAEVLVKDQKSFLIRDRETLEDLLYNVHFPPHLQTP